MVGTVESGTALLVVSRAAGEGNSRLKTLRWLGTAIGLALLLAGTVMVFQAFDRQSHSASDTLRPFLITMVPVWLIALAGAVAVLRMGSK